MMMVISYSFYVSVSSVFFYYIYISADFDGAFFISGWAEGVFAEHSNTEQWLQKGEEFMKQSLYEVAAKCFNRGKDFHWEKIAKAYQLAFLASRYVLFFSLTIKCIGKRGTIMKRKERANAKYYYKININIF